MRDRNDISISTIIVLLFFTLTACGQNRNCNANVIITDIGEAQLQIESLYQEQDFYDTDKSQYYMFEIILDTTMSIVEIKTVFYNNDRYVDAITGIIKTFTFQLIEDGESCDKYSLPFIINARLRTISYPGTIDYYKVDLPIE